MMRSAWQLFVLNFLVLALVLQRAFGFGSTAEDAEVFVQIVLQNAPRIELSASAHLCVLCG
jgi:hypothetical protein